MIVAEIVFVPTALELSVPVATPLAFVVAAGWTRVFPIPVAARATLTPPTPLPKTSLAVTVIVEVTAPPLAGMLVGTATMVV